MSARAAAPPPADPSCRADVWLWRARFFKTRALACRAVEEGRVRLLRAGAESRLDKASRTLRPGDVLVFAQGARLVTVRVEAPGDRRGPAPEARALYSDLAPLSARVDHADAGRGSGLGGEPDAGARPAAGPRRVGSGS